MGVSKELLMRRRNLGSPHIATATGAVVNFAGNMIAPFKELKCEFTPVQASGIPSPESPLPISGWTGANIYQRGKNLFDNWLLGYYSPGQSKFSSYNVNNCTSKPIKMQRGTQVYLSQADNSQDYSFEEWGILPTSENDLIASNLLARESSSSAGASRAYTVQNDCWLTARVNLGASYSESVFAAQHPQLEIGSTATTYAPYTGNTYAVDWTDEAGTVYGGYVDPVRGVLRAEWANIASYNGETLPAEWMSDRDVYVAGTAPTTGAQVVYQLATPIEYPLTPQVIKTLKGVNNVFGDANGDITVQYWKH